LSGDADALVPYADNFMGSGACSQRAGPHPATPVATEPTAPEQGCARVGRTQRADARKDADVGFPASASLFLVAVTSHCDQDPRSGAPTLDRHCVTEVPAHS